MRDKNIFAILFIALLISVQAQVPFVYTEENTGKECKKPPLPEPSNLKKVDKLPNPFEWSDGSGKIKSLEEWKCRRAEIKAEIEKYEQSQKLPKLKPHTMVEF